MITDSFVPANMSNKGALPDSGWTDNWQDLQFFRTMGLFVQQETNDKFYFHLAAKHAVTQQYMHAVRLAIQARVAHQENDQLIHINNHGGQAVKCLS